MPMNPDVLLIMILYGMSIIYTTYMIVIISSNSHFTLFLFPLACKSN